MSERKQTGRRSSRGLEPFAEQQRALSALGLDRIEEALLCVPDHYSDLRSAVRNVQRAPSERPELFILQLTGEMNGYGLDGIEVDLESPDGWKSARRLVVRMEDDVGTPVRLTVFGSAWPYRRFFGVPSRCAWLGRLKHIASKGHPIAALDDVELIAPGEVGRVVPRYKGIPGRVSGAVVAQLVNSQIDNPAAAMHCAGLLNERTGLSDAEALSMVGASDRFESLGGLILALHRPTDPQEADAARTAARSLAMVEVRGALERKARREPHGRAPIPVGSQAVEALVQRLPFSLTVDQSNALKAMVQRVQSRQPMAAVLNGDVGSGKSAPYYLLAGASHMAGATVAVIAPTDLLASQIAREMVALLPQGVQVERVFSQRRIKDPHAILVGTVGLATQLAAIGLQPNLLVLDEEHKFGADARERLVAPWTHVLEVTATPLPRTLASILVGGKEVFELTSPPGERRVKTVLTDESRRSEITRKMRAILAAGGRVAIVYPRLDGARQSGLRAAKIEDVASRSVLAAARALEGFFPGVVAVAHGRMTPDELDAAVSGFRDGVTRLLVATTVIETGINIPSLQLVIVRQPHLFGLAQLHQLRGRLARGGGDGEFVLMADDLTTLGPVSMKSLAALVAEPDGYKIAEIDLQQRGFGGVDGVDQSGRIQSSWRLLALEPEDCLVDEAGSREWGVAPDLADSPSQDALPRQQHLF